MNSTSGKLIVSGFGRRLEELIYDRWLTVQEVCIETGISHTQMWAYIHERYMPSCYVLVQLANFFEVSTDYLLGLEDEE